MEKTEFIKKFDDVHCDALEAFIKTDKDTVYSLLYVKASNIERYFIETVVTNDQDGRHVHINGEIDDTLTECPSVRSFHRKWRNREIENLTPKEQSDLRNEISNLLDQHEHIITEGLFKYSNDIYAKLFSSDKN